MNTDLWLPLVFEENAGQAPDDVRWVMSKPAGMVWFLDDRIVFHYRVSGERSESIVMALPAAIRPVAAARLRAHGRLASRDGSRKFSLATAIVYKNLIDDIDLVFYIDAGTLRYDVVARPGANPADLTFTFDGGHVQLDKNGHLAVLGPSGGVWHSAPRCFAERGGKRTKAPGAFVRRSENTAGFTLPRRSRNATTVIDPELVFGAYIDPIDQQPSAIMDASGVFCDIASGAIWWTAGGATVPYTVRRLDCSNPAAPQIVFNIVLRARALETIVSAGPHVYLAGIGLEDFPVPPDAADPDAPPAQRNYILRLEADGTPLRATYFRFAMRDIAVDVSNAGDGVYVTGGYITGGLETGWVDGARYGTAIRSPRNGEAIAAKLSADLRTVEYFTSFGIAAGASSTWGWQVTARDGHAYILGTTQRDDIATPGAFSAVESPGMPLVDSHRTFISKLAPDGRLLFTGVVGHNEMTDLAVDIRALADGTCVFGVFRLNPQSATAPGPQRWLLYRAAADGSALIYTNEPAPAPNHFAVTSNGTLWLGGRTSERDLSTGDAAQPQPWYYGDGFVCRLNAARAHDYFTYVGGSGEDDIQMLAAGSTAVFAIGSTESPDLIPGSIAFQGTYSGQRAYFLAIFADRGPSVGLTKRAMPASPLAVNQSLTYTISVTNDTSHPLTQLVLDDMPPAEIQLFPAPPWQQTGPRVFVDNISLQAGERREFSLEGIGLEPGCFVNRAQLSLGGVVLATQDLETCFVAPPTAPLLTVTISDDSAAFASDAGANPATVIVTIRNISDQPAQGLTLMHRAQGRLRFERLRPVLLTLDQSDPTSTRDPVTGNLSPSVIEYGVRFGTLGPGEVVRAFATSGALKNGVYKTDAEVLADGFPAYSAFTSHTFVMGPVGDVLIDLAIAHTPATGSGPQRFDLSVTRSAGDQGEPVPAFTIQAIFAVPHGTVFQEPVAGRSLWLTMPNGRFGFARQISQAPAGDVWLGTFVVTELPVTATIHLPGGLQVSSMRVHLEGPIRNPPPEVSWP